MYGGFYPQSMSKTGSTPSPCTREDCKRHREALELISNSPFIKGIQAIGIVRDALKPPKESK
jgi:hypothetical protein